MFNAGEIIKESKNIFNGDKTNLLKSFADGFLKLQVNEVDVILCSAKIYTEMRKQSFNNEFIPNNDINTLKFGVMGVIWKTNVVVNSKIEDNVAYISGIDIDDKRKTVKVLF